MRKLILSGRLAANAETKLTKGGTQYVEFRMANNEYKGGTDNKGKETYWFRVVSFNANHVKLVPYLTKGKSLEVIGDLQTSPYISNITNKAEAGLEVRANDIMFDNNFGSPQQGTNDSTTHQTATAPTPAPAAQAEAAPKKSAPRNPTTATVPQSAAAPAPAADDGGEDDLPF